MTIAFRRDSFCGKMSICNNLKQYGIPYSLTRLHTEAPDVTRVQGRPRVVSPAYAAWYAVSRTSASAQSAHVPQPSTPSATQEAAREERHHRRDTRLSEVMGRIGRMKDTDDAAQEKLSAIKKYIPVGETPEAALIKMAKLGAVIDQWMTAGELTVSAVQCWTSIEEFLRIVPCTVMSMMSENLIPSACEVDVLAHSACTR